MRQDISIRIGKERDMETLIRFNIEIARETEARELPLDVVSAGVRALLSNPQYGFYVVAEKDDVVVGSLMVTTEWSDWRNGVFWWIQSVYVRPEFRRQGIYRKLYEYVKARAIEQSNVCGFRLYVERENVVAQKAYQALGMKETRYKMYEELLQH
ncbi:MAG: GNAT family N-acetyltransferase [candidate division KSB1 bacterium]|nr:GNAT family N-acetyltransferase [candidate division KSB1 bacterium]